MNTLKTAREFGRIPRQISEEKQAWRYVAITGQGRNRPRSWQPNRQKWQPLWLCIRPIRKECVVRQRLQEGYKVSLVLLVEAKTAHLQVILQQRIDCS